MLKNRIIFLIFIFLGGICLNFTHGIGMDSYMETPNHQHGFVPSTQGFSNGKEGIPMAATHDPHREDYKEFRMGSWDHRQNWRYNREAYLQGKTQAQYYRERYPFGPGRIGYDADREYVRRYEEAQKLKNSGNSKNLGNSNNNQKQVLQSKGTRKKDL